MPNTKPIGVAYEDPQLDAAIVGKTGGTAGFYGKTPVSQRAYTANVHNSTAVVTSASFGTLQVAQLNEIQNTLIGLGVWATA